MTEIATPRQPEASVGSQESTKVSRRAVPSIYVCPISASPRSILYASNELKKKKKKIVP